MLDTLARHRADGLVTTADALRHGLWSQLQRAHAIREWTRVWRGVYLPTEQWSLASPTERHLLVLRAVTLTRSTPTIAGVSAAVAWGLPVLRLPDRPEVLVHRGDQRVRSAVRGVLDRGQRRMLVNGFVVTSPESTFVDVVARHGGDAGVVVGDAMAHIGLSSRDALMGEATDYAATHVKRRRTVLDVAASVDGRAESPLESLSRRMLAELDAPPPELQAVLPVRSGRRYRVDFLWRAARVVGECDGRTKYGADESAAAGSVWEEKVREDALRDSGWRVIRWTWGDLYRPGVLAARVAAAGLIRRPSGTVA